VRLDGSLVEAAGQHASDMVRRHYFDHTDPEGRTPTDRMRDAGFRGSATAENIATGYDSAQRAFAGWMQSDGHRANILDCDYNRVGIGYDPGRISSQWGGGTWVQNFGRD
jgi:uncharacterized protein YkwD